MIARRSGSTGNPKRATTKSRANSRRGRAMPSAERQLPDFARPPVNEVYLSVQFEPISDFRAAHLGLFWERLRPGFVRIEDQPPLPHQLEVFGVKQPAEQSVQLRLLQRPDPPRCWYVKDDERHLVQLQADRFIYNWRKVKDDDEYPRYPNVRRAFAAELRKLEAFLTEEKLGP